MADHGTYACYTHGKCRCDECRAANAKNQQKCREARFKRAGQGEIPAGVKHGAAAYGNWGCRCGMCVSEWYAKCRAPRAAWAKRNPQKVNELNRAQHAREQSVTIDKAHRSYAHWTGPELELASRKDLTAKQVAFMIGRSYAAVKSMRRKLRDDPKTINLAGVHHSVADR